MIKTEPLSESRLNARLVVLALVVAALSFVDDLLARITGIADLTTLTGVWLQARRFANVTWWLALSLLLFLALEILVWRTLRGRKVAVPKLLVDLVRALVFTVAIFGVVSALFDQTLTGLLATSGFIAIVLGFALQSTLADLFSGIALNIERPFRVGDLVRVDNDVIGKVVQSNWRATRLRSVEGNEIVIPNSKMAAAQVVNLNMPQQKLRQTIVVNLPAEVSPNHLQPLLVASALHCRQVLSDPMPRARVKEFLDMKIAYEVVYWIDSYEDSDDIRSEISCEIWRQLEIEDVSLLGPFAPVGQANAGAFSAESGDQDAALRVLGRADLFRLVDSASREAIAQRLTRLNLKAGEVVIRQGDESDRLFFVGEGLLEVSIEGTSGRQVGARLNAAQIFGEMSFLTGEARSATVTAKMPSLVYTISRADFIEVLRDNENLATELREVLVRRRLANDALLNSLTKNDSAPDDSGGDIFARLTALLGFSLQNPSGSENR